MDKNSLILDEGQKEQLPKEVSRAISGLMKFIEIAEKEFLNDKDAKADGGLNETS